MSFVLIDKDKMMVRYKHSDALVLGYLMHIEYPHCTASIMPCEATKRWQAFSDLELKLLYKNLVGSNFPGFERRGLEHNVVQALGTLPDSDVNIDEARAQSDCIPVTSQGNYRFAPGAMKPIELEEPFAAKALQAAKGFAPTTPPPPPANAAPTPAAAPVNPFLQAPAPRAPAAPRPPRDPNAPPVSAEAPKRGATARVWEIAEKIWIESGKPDPKDIRKQIVKACEDEGINTSTAGVQFGKWRATK